jgi:hypothetical protein
VVTRSTSEFTAMQVHFPDSLRLRVPRGMPAAVQQAAKQRHTTPAEWARQALLRGLEADGVQLREPQAQAKHPIQLPRPK